MKKGTTPTLVFDLSESTNLNLGMVQQVWVTFKISPYIKTFDITRCSINADKKTISITLTQEETLELPVCNIEVQIRLLLTDNSAFATEIVKLDVNKILKEGVIE